MIKYSFFMIIFFVAKVSTAAHPPVVHNIQFGPEVETKIRDFAATYWAHVDNPDIHPYPSMAMFREMGHNFDPFIDSELLLTEIYRHRLRLNPSEGELYSLFDLMNDDPAVKSAFRHHTLTGELITQFSAGPEAVLSHINLVVNDARQDGDPGCEETELTLNDSDVYLQSYGVHSIQQSASVTKKPKTAPDLVRHPDLSPPTSRSTSVIAA